MLILSKSGSGTACPPVLLKINPGGGLCGVGGDGEVEASGQPGA